MNYQVTKCSVLNHLPSNRSCFRTRIGTEWWARSRMCPCTVWSRSTWRSSWSGSPAKSCPTSPCKLSGWVDSSWEQLETKDSYCSKRQSLPGTEFRWRTCKTPWLESKEAKKVDQSWTLWISNQLSSFLQSGMRKAKKITIHPKTLAVCLEIISK